MSDNNDFGSFLAGFMIGGLVGAAVALLLAPQSGEETRQVIKDRGIVLRDRAVAYGQDARTRAEHALEEARLRVDETMEELRARTRELSRLTDDWIEQVRRQVGREEEGAQPEAPESA